MLDTLAQDVRYALRALRRSPGFTLVAVLTLALGIGANSAIFSVVNSVLFTPLPYRDPGRLVLVWERKGPSIHNVVNPANYMDWHDRATSFSSLSALAWAGLTFTGDQPERVRGRSVTPDFFATLGASPLLGRTFTAEESRPHAAPVIVLSEGLWKRRFAADPGIIGRAVPVSGGTARVVGVMPASFRPMPLGSEEYWEPFALDWSDRTRSGRYALVVGRLKDGVTLERAQAEMAGIAAQLEREVPDYDTGWGTTVLPLMEQVVGSSRRIMLIVLGAVSLVLLIACANVANLMLARAAARERELSVRAALGAPRWRLARQALAESVLLAVAGGSAGLLLASWGVDLLVAAAPAGVPRLSDIHLDPRVFAFTAVVSIAVGVLFGRPAALRRPGQAQGLPSSATRTTAGLPATRLRGALVIAQVSLAIVLLVGAGLLVRSIRRLVAVDPGFDPRDVAAVNINLPAATYRDSASQVAFYDQLLGRVRAIPGVRSAAIVSWLPMTDGDARTGLTVVGRPTPAPGQGPTAAIRSVDPGYFEAMRIPLKRGRALAGTDRPGTVPVAVISEAMAHRLWPGEDPVGQQVRVRWAHPERQVEIVGVVGDVRHGGLDAEVQPTLYYPFAQEPQGEMSLVLRSNLPPTTLTSGVRDVLRRLDRDLPLRPAVTMYQQIAEMMLDRRYPMFLLSLFAALAVTLAAIGIYGVLAYTVSQRTHEIGVRMALGARPADVLRHVMGAGLALTLTGVGIGSLTAAFAARALGTLLYGVHPADPVTFLAVAALLVAVALLAMALPARRAASTDPMIALRSE
jgi:putative ABC transport system permease protein